jgi:type VI secretion system protein ImpL
MLSFLFSFFRWRTLIALLGLAALAALVWYAGPLLYLWGSAPLAAADTRLLIIVGLFVVVIGVVLVRYWLARRANARMISKLMDSDGLMSLTETQSQEEVTILRERFEDALKLLKETRFQGAHGSGFLLDLPWYIIIGPPGSGKTTLLRNSGLDFPLADRVGGDVLAGVGGTRNCDWWFTNEGVLLDTAGRYTTQDSNAVIDRAAWRGFLDLLKEFRRRRPINGIMLAIGLDDILNRTSDEQAERIETFRQRLQELMRSFGMRLPVYLMITKCDLLSGFAEFFDTLTDEERQQVWGMTFTPVQADATLQASFEENFSELLQRVLDRMPARLQEERDPVRRRLIYAFPQQFGAIRTLVSTFVGQVFRENRYEMAPMLRGVYFTSGTQEGTPIDRLMSSFSRAFGLSEVQVPRPFGKGKTYFIHDFLTDVLIAESGLVGVDKKLERRLAVTHSLGYAAAVFIAVALGVLWFSAFTRSSSEASTLSTQASQFEQLRGRTPPTDIVAALPALDKARSIGQFYDQHGIFETWVQRVGLSSAASLATPARAVYRQALTVDLLPLLVRRLEAQLAKAAASGATNQQLHDQLKLYLMLNETAHFEKAALLGWMRSDAAAVFPLDSAKRTALLAHYQALLDLMPIQVAINRDLVAGVRHLLVRVPQADAVYDILRKGATGNPALPAFSFAQAVGSAADVAFADPNSTGLRTQIPGFYTREGFYTGFVARLPGVVGDQMQSDWVLGQDAGSPSVAAAEDLMRHVSDLYVRDYIAVWQAAISRVTLTPWNSFDGLNAVLQALMGPDKPLEKILEAVKTNTELPRDRSLGGAPAAGAQPAGQQPAPSKSLTDTISSVITNATTTVQTTAAALAIPDPWPGDQIKTPFQPLAGLVGGASGQQQAPIVKITDEIGAVYAVITKIQQHQDPGEAAFQLIAAQRSSQAPDAAAVLRNDAVTRPSPIREVMLRIAGAASATIAGGAQDRVLAAWRATVLPSCLALVSNRYPFDRSSRDEAALSDFADFFKPGGTLDQFEKAFIPDKPVQTVSAGGGGGGARRPLPAALLTQLDIGDRIRAAFFGGKGAELSVKFGLQATFLDPKLAAAVINIDDQLLVYRHDPPRLVDFQWPSQSASGTAKLSLKDFSTDATIFEEQGPWAVFRLFDDIGLRATARVSAYSLEGKRNDLRAAFTLVTNASINAFDFSMLRQFKCLSSF